MELTRPSGLNQVTVVWNMDSITCITLLLIENLVCQFESLRLSIVENPNK